MQTAKCVVLGDAGVGKTSLLIRYTAHILPVEYIPRVFDHCSDTVIVDDTPVKQSLWDTAEEESLHRRQPLPPQTDVFLILFSLGSPSSLNNISRKWLKDIARCCPGTPFLLVGSKADLLNNPLVRESYAEQDIEFVCQEQAPQFAERIGAAGYVECSALTGDGVAEVFEEAIRIVLQSETKKKKSKTRFGSLTGRLR